MMGSRTASLQRVKSQPRAVGPVLPSSEAPKDQAAVRHKLSKKADIMLAFIEQHQKRYHICRLWASCIAGVILACTWAAGATGVTGIVTDHGAQHVLVTVFGIVGGVVTIWQRICLPSAKAARFQTAIQQYGLMLDQIQKALIEADHVIAEKGAGAWESTHATLEAVYFKIEKQLFDVNRSSPPVPLYADGSQNDTWYDSSRFLMFFKYLSMCLFGPDAEPAGPLANAIPLPLPAAGEKPNPMKEPRHSVLLDEDDYPEDLKRLVDRSPMQGEAKLSANDDGGSAARTVPSQVPGPADKAVLPRCLKVSTAAAELPGSQSGSKHGDENV